MISINIEGCLLMVGESLRLRNINLKLEIEVEPGVLEREKAVG